MSNSTTNEVSFKNTLSILNEERNKALSLSGANMYKMMHLIDILTKRVIDSMEEHVDNVVLVGSTVELDLVYGDGFSETVEYTISNDFFDDNVISFYTPLGSSILGKKVDSVFEYQVQEIINRGKITSIKNEKEKQKLLTNN